MTLAKIATGTGPPRRWRVPGSEGALYPQAVATADGGGVVAWTAEGSDGARRVAMARARLGG